MRRLFALSAFLGLGVACVASGTGRYDQNVDTGPFLDSEEEDDDDTEDTTEETDDDSDTDTGEGPPPCHPWHPVEDSGWSRTYDVTYKDTSGQEVEVGYGQAAAPTGIPAFMVTTTGASGRGTFTNYYKCDFGPFEELHLGEWEGTMVLPNPVPLLPDTETQVNATYKPPVQLLGPPADVAVPTTWTYSSVKAVKNASTGNGGEVLIDGSIEVLGLGNAVTTGYGEFTNALKLNHTIFEDRDGLPWAKHKGVTKVTGEQYFVEGLGLVYERFEHMEGSDGTGVYLERSLTAFSKLSPAP